MTYKEAEFAIENNKKAEISKEYTVPFLFHLFTLNVFSEDRQNGEHKHFITISFLGFRFISIIYRTGMNNCYHGTVSKRNMFISFLYDAWDEIQGILFYTSNKVYKFLDRHDNLHWLIRNRFYDGKRFDFDNTRGISKRGFLDGQRDIEWKSGDMKCVFTVDDETERIMKEGNLYIIEMEKESENKCCQEWKMQYDR